MSSMIQDLMFAWRLLYRRPALAMVAGASMAAGIALTATVFNLLDAAVLRPLPVADPNRLVVILSGREGGVNHNLSYPDFVDYRSGQRAFTDIAASGNASVTIQTQSGAIVVEAEMVSGSYFQTLGVGARAGRALVDSDFAAGAPPAAVVTESLWREIAGAGTAFDAREAIVNGQAFAVVGLAPRGFRGIQIGRDVRLWTTINHQTIVAPFGGQRFWDRRTASWLTVLGRLKPDTTLEQGAADMNRIEAALGPSVSRQEKRTMLLAPGAQGDSMLPTATAEPLQLLFGAALLVVIVAAANVANLLAARASDRHRELAVRVALGAGRGRLVRLLVAEALLIGAMSSAVALVAASWLATLVVPLLPGLEDPAGLDAGLSWRTAGFVSLLGLVTSVIASVMPIARILRGATTQALAAAGRSVSAGAGSQRLRRVLVVSQFALSLGLVVAATLLTRTLVNVRGIDTGLALERVVLMSVDPEAAGYKGPRIREYLDEAVARLSGVPGVEASAYGRVIPLGFGGSRATIEIPGYVPGPAEDMEINFNTVSAGYFTALGIQGIHGRVVSDRDNASAPPVAVVNETMARQFWPGGAAVGRTFSFSGSAAPPFEVIGVVRDVKYRALREGARPSFYVAAGQSRNVTGGVLHVRTSGDPAPLLVTLRKALTEVDRNVPVTAVRTLREQRNRNTAGEELAVTIGVVLGGVALALAAVGLFAAMSSSVVGRTREIGVRLALGARPAEIVGLVLADGLRLVVAGAALGLTLAYSITGVIEQRLYGISARDPLSFVAGVIVLAAVALVAAWAPAYRAATVDPIQALKTE